MGSAAQIAQAATGHGLLVTKICGSQPTPTVDAQLQTSRRQCLVEIAALLRTVSVAPTVASAVGPGTLMMLTNGPERVPLADARTGGATESLDISSYSSLIDPFEIRLNRSARVW